MIVKFKINSATRSILITPTQILLKTLSFAPIIFVLVSGLASVADPANLHKVVLLLVSFWFSVFVFASLYFKNSLIDPKSFIQVLLFALVIISLYLFSGGAQLNTFGTYPVHYLGGVYIVALIGLYYLSYWSKRFISLVNVNMVVVFIGVLSAWALGYNFGVPFINIVNLSIGIIYAISGVINSQNSGLKTLYSLASIIMFYVLALQSFATKDTTLTLIIPLFIAGLIVIRRLDLTVLSNQVALYFNNYLNKFKILVKSDIPNDRRALSIIRWVISLFLIIIIFLIIILNNVFSALASLGQGIIRNIQFLAEQGTGVLVIGKGASAISSNVAVAGNQSLVGIIVNFLGLGGLVLFITFASFVIFKLLHKKSNLVRSNYLIIFALPVLSLTSIPSLFIVALWWINFGLLDAADQPVTEWERRPLVSRIVPTWLLKVLIILIPLGVLIGCYLLINRIP